MHGMRRQASGEKMILKVHGIRFRGMKETIVCVCDDEHIGKTYSENGKELFVNARFYNGEKKSVEEIKKELKQASIMNFVGAESVGLGIDEGYVDAENVVEIQKIPHAQVVFMKNFA